MTNESKAVTFLWIIENYSYCWHENGEGLLSSDFIFKGFEDTSWYLLLYPKGYTAKDKGHISLFLVQNESESVPETVTVKYELSFLTEDGSVLNPRNSEYILDTYSTYEKFYQFLQTDEIHFKEHYLSNDTLRVSCRMWIGEGGIQNAEQISARTRIITEQISFYHDVESFNTLKPNVKHTVEISSPLDSRRNVSSSLYYTDGLCGEGEIVIEIVPSDAQHILHKCKIYFVIEYDNLIECGGINNVYDAERKSMYKIPLSITRESVMNKKNKYSVVENLTLWCECTFSSRLLFNIIEEANQEFPLPFIKQESKKAVYKHVCKAVENISEYTSALEDIKALYINQRLTDVKLKTSTKSFPAHKIVLCARSAVFEAMLTSEMKEKITATIQIDDLEDDIVEQLLLFLYSDSLETLQWGSATQLYYAADKYQIGKLKAMCSSFLVEKLTHSNASELLLLCDTHNDSKLMRVVEDYILKHEEQVYCSDGWKKLRETDPRLALKTMCLKYERKK